MSERDRSRSRDRQGQRDRSPAFRSNGGRSRSPRRQRSGRSRSRSPSYSRSRSPSRRRDRSPYEDRRERRGSYSHGSSGRYRSGGYNADSSSGQNRRVYVGNLAYDVRWHNLKDFMKSAGEVIHADVLTLPNGMSKGCGIVEYASAEDAQHAIDHLSNQTLMGRTVYIREDREQEPRGAGRGGFSSRGSERGGISSRGGGYGGREAYDSGRGSYGGPGGTLTNPQLYISNLPFNVGWQDLKDLFRNAGSVVRADVHMAHDGRPKGTGIVSFETIADAQRALDQYQGYEFNGRNLEIKEDRFAQVNAARGGMRGGRGAFAGGRGGSSSRGGHGSGGYDYPPRSYEPLPPNPFTDNAIGNGEPSSTIFVRNLPWSTSNDDLVELFSTTGKVERAEIQYEPNGRSKGTGVVQFDVIDSAQISISKFTGYLYGGRPLGLSFVSYQNDNSTPMLGHGDSMKSVDANDAHERDERHYYQDGGDVQMQEQNEEML